MCIRYKHYKLIQINTKGLNHFIKGAAPTQHHLFFKNELRQRYRRRAIFRRYILVGEKQKFRFLYSLVENIGGCFLRGVSVIVN